MILVAGFAVRMRSVAAMPSQPGIRTSITTTSGRVASIRRTASSPSCAGDDGHVGLAADQRLEALEDDRMVVHDGDRDRSRGTDGFHVILIRLPDMSPGVGQEPDPGRFLGHRMFATPARPAYRSTGHLHGPIG